MKRCQQLTEILLNNGGTRKTDLTRQTTPHAEGQTPGGIWDFVILHGGGGTFPHVEGQIGQLAALFFYMGGRGSLRIGASGETGNQYISLKIRPESITRRSNT